MSFAPGEVVIYIGDNHKYGKRVVFVRETNDGESAVVEGEDVFVPLLTDLRKLTPLEQILE